MFFWCYKWLRSSDGIDISRYKLEVSDLHQVPKTLALSDGHYIHPISKSSYQSRTISCAIYQKKAVVGSFLTYR